MSLALEPHIASKSLLPTTVGVQLVTNRKILAPCPTAKMLLEAKPQIPVKTCGRLTCDEVHVAPLNWRMLLPAGSGPPTAVTELALRPQIPPSVPTVLSAGAVDHCELL